MALNAATVWEVRTTGSDTNGGGFRAGAAGVDYSQQDSPQANWTGDVTATTTIVNVTGHTVSADDVGNHVQINTGTATAGVYEITAADVGNNRWTLDRSAGASAATITAATMGGAFASPGKAGSVKVAGNHVWIKSGTYTLSNSSNVAAGRVTDATGGGAAAYSRWVGYGSARGDSGTRPLLQAGAALVNLITASGARVRIENLEFAPNANANVTGVMDDGTHTHVLNCKFTGTLIYGYRGNTASGARVRSCEASGCTTAAYSLTATSQALGCVALSPTGTSAFSLNGAGSIAWRCVARGGTALRHFVYTQSGGLMVGCASHGGAGDGFDFGSTVGNQAVNCVAYGAADRGFEAAAGSANLLINCAGGGNAADYDAADFPADSVEGFVTLTADPFTDAANGDFTLNNTAGGGAALKGAGYPQTLPGLTGESHPDVGAYQSAASFATGGGFIGRLNLRKKRRAAQ
jgi:hypothetical protein